MCFSSMPLLPCLCRGFAGVRWKVLEAPALSPLVIYRLGCSSIPLSAVQETRCSAEQSLVFETKSLEIESATKRFSSTVTCEVAVFGGPQGPIP